MCDNVSILVGLKSPFMLWDKCLSWAIETMDPKKLELPQVSHAGEVPAGGGGVVSWKENSPMSENLPDHLAGQTRTNSAVSVMGGARS